MKEHGVVYILLAVAALLLLFAGCKFETDGNFVGLVAGVRNNLLQPPYNVKAVADSSGGIQISWDASDGADGYTVFRATAGNQGSPGRRGSTGGTSFTDSGASVSPATPYYYQVTAYRGYGDKLEESKPSKWAGPAAAVQNPGILSAPEITGAAASGNAVTVTWTPVTGADGYILYRASMYDGDVYTVRITTNTVLFRDENLTAGSYLYQVRGYNSGGDGYASMPSDPVGVTTGPALPAPAKPGNLRAAASYPSQLPVITVTWNAVSGAGRYAVLRSADNEYFEIVGETTSTTYQDTSAGGGGAYYYRVRGYNGIQEGYMSDSYGPVLLLPGRPELASSFSDNDVTVSWDGLRGADMYYVYRSSGDYQFQLLTPRGTGNTAYTDLGLDYGTYYYRAEAANSAGRGFPSDNKQVLIAFDAMAPEISGQLAGGTYLQGVTATPLGVAASIYDGGTLTYRWHSNTVNSNSGGSVIPGAVTASYTPPTAAAGTVYYYVVITNTNNRLNGNKTATAVSNAAAVTVVGGLAGAVTPVIVVQPEDGEYSQGGAATALAVEASAGDGGTLSYQWYSNTVNSNSGGSLIDGAVSTSYTPPTDTAGTLYYYVIVTNTNNNATATAASGTAEIRILINAETPVISDHPAGGVYSQGGAATALSVQASVSDGGALSYQWYSNTVNSNSGGSLISGAANASYTPPTTAAGTRYYYVVITNTNNAAEGNKTATAASNAAEIRVMNAGIIISPLSMGEWGLVEQAAQAESGVNKQFAVAGTYAEYQWYLDGASAGTASTYTFNRPAGVYELVVVVRNSAGERRSGRCRITVTGQGTISLAAATPAEFTAALSAIQSSPGNHFTVTANSDISLGPQDLTLAAYRNKRITLRGNTAARTVSLSSQGSLFTVGADTELVLEDIVLVGRSDNNTSLVKVNTDGKLVLNNGGKVTGNTYSTSVTETGGAGVLVNGGTLEIAGGEVSGNTVNGTARDVQGGGVYAVNDSDVLMTSGAIRDNLVTNVASGDSGANGGGIRLGENSRFEMTGGVIEGNTVNHRSTTMMAGTSGGGVGIYTDSSFYFSGGTIRNNSCNSLSGNNYGVAYGGGVHVDSGNFVMSGGIVNGNSCTSSINPNKGYGTNGLYRDGAYGGGIAIHAPISFVKTGGIVYGNDIGGSDADGIPLKNTAQSDANGIGGGHAVFYNNLEGNANPKRNATAYATDNMDSSVSGSAGGWE